MNKGKLVIISVLSGILSAFSFDFSCLWYMIFLSVSPVIYNILKYKSNIIFSLSVFSFTFYCISDIWILSVGTNYFDNKYPGVLISFLLLFLISAILSVFFILPFTVYKITGRKKFNNVLTICFMYILGEWLQGQFIPFAFPWNRLCNIVVQDTKFIQTASISGGLFITFLIVLINSMFALFFIYLSKREKKAIIFPIGALCIYFANIFAGTIIIKNTVNNNEPEKVILVQGNYSKKEKWNADPEIVFDRYLEILKNNMEPDTELAVFPETALSGIFFESNEQKEKLFEFCKEQNITLLFGAQYNDVDLRYNACAAAFPDKRFSDIYFKQILVPFGEYNPFFENSKFQFISNAFSKGSECVVIDTDIGKLGCGICFESVFPELISQNSVLGAEILVILTNDSWLGKFIPLYQHHSHSVLRAVENKKYVINCTNTGISSVISSDGEIISQSDINCFDTVTANVYSNNQITFYTLYGDLIIIVSCIIVSCLCFKMIFFRIREIIMLIKNSKKVE